MRPRLLDGEGLADRPAGGQSDEVGARDSQRIHESGEVGGHLVHGKLALQPVACAGAALVVRDHPEAGAEYRDLRLPVTPHAVQTADEDQRGPFARLLVVDLTARDGDFRHGASTSSKD